MDEAVDTFLKSDDLKSALGAAKKFAESKNFSGKKNSEWPDSVIMSGRICIESGD